MRGGFEGALIGGAGSIRAIGLLTAGLAGGLINATSQLIGGIGDPCFEFDFRSLLIDAGSALGGGLVGGAVGGLAGEAIRVSGLSAARAGFRAGNVPIRTGLNGFPPTDGQLIGQSIGGSAAGAASEIVARADRTSRSQG